MNVILSALPSPLKSMQNDKMTNDKGELKKKREIQSNQQFARLNMSTD